ncbi:flagellar hook-length control protein FliK [Microbacterium sp. AISO3]|uniref:flagellar hook-length control protein FliK n=1 Tax=Microbacterium sp. AISO3 TaxID=2002831 RepID=UPI001A8CD241|nr:flagellar hook-length control protein FliK [Microbacterium sp. AISO3]
MAAEPGRHTMVLRVSPESLGPITVTAHISGSSVTVELTSGTAAAHDAIRAVLGDLRRELAVLAPFSSVSLTPGDDPSRASTLPPPAQHAGGAGGTAGQTSDGGASDRTPQQTPDDPGRGGRPGHAPAVPAELPHDPARPAPLEAGRIDLYA